jgi:long-chain acyl-CoA synthetase
MPASLFAGEAAQRPEKPVLVDGEGTHTWAALLRRAGRVRADLAAQGVGPGERVAIRIESPLELTVAVLGTLATGATVTPLNPRLAADESEVILADLQPALTISQAIPGEADFDPRVVATEAPAFVLYTSGSTGQPKGVVLSHGAVAAALAHWRGPVMALGPDDVVLSTLPPAHSFGLFGSILGPLSAGATVVFLRRFTPEAALAAIARARVSVFPGVATMFQRILECPDLAGSDLASLRIAVSGAAPCPWELAEKWRAVTGARIIRGYGMTELFRPISFMAEDENEAPLAIGRAMPEVRLRIVDDDGEELATGETGELWINSPARLSEYLNRPAETAEVLTADWFRTGDLATISADGFVTIAGRIKDVILRGGYTVAAGEIEAVLESHDDIAEAAVVGVPDPELGEEIAAFVTLGPDAASTEADIIAYCRQRLASYKYPRRIEIVESLPKGPTGKILKARLQA